MLIMVLMVMEQLTRSPMGIPAELCEQFYGVAHYFAAEHTTPPSEHAFIQIVVLMVRLGICEPHLTERVLGCLLEWISANSPAKHYESELLYEAALRGIAELAACYPTKLQKLIDPLRDFILYSTTGMGEAPSVSNEAVTALCSILRLEMTSHGVEIPRQLINSLFNLLHPSMHYNTPTSPPSVNASTSSISSIASAPTTEELHRIIIPLLGRITCALDDPKV